jgi:chemotaxis protein methyltransferase CheR
MSGQLERLADLVRERSGIAMHGAQRIEALAKALAKVAPGMDVGTALRVAHDPRDGARFVRTLVEAVTVHETFFFRQRKDLDAIDWRRLLVGAQRAGSPRVRVWVAGCSTGEEPYTLAILAGEAFGGEAPVSILATDLSGAAIARAQTGRYAGRTIRALEPRLRERWFERDGQQLVVRPALRRVVDFRRHNLVAEPPPQPPFDLVVCRNVLIYFDPATCERVLARLDQALAPEGTLLLGAADRLCRPGGAPRVGEPRPRRPAPAPVLVPDGARAPGAGWRARRPSPPQPPPGAPDGAADGTAPELRAALAAADAGRLDEAAALVDRVLAADPLDADAYFVRGVARLGGGDAAGAVEPLRRALYLDPAFALAAFQLARAHDRLGDATAARRAYRQALRVLAPGHERQQRLAPDVDLADIAAACGARLAALGGWT